ncbi:BrnT family toxin [Roseinatronobacter bogoriensis]|uniref:BrnT family toxin n=1 Tax=Roseinatronobacter bogoriensis TaxID=119542 RepID=UPI0008F918E9|nr:MULTISPECIES: BrnT family toxin [Rhodobaca]MBB4206413.1 uncharacterized DUF497 family protein [Rhodobaca bogoriensis DSM 18756]TDW41157.1 uncharacterized DUF497 family protein [Rhodobaca barguzinensis]TDY74665.1 uncharacterized DUF497 family protein [Rhodobaca bogoriensis DSM 18756]
MINFAWDHGNNSKCEKHGLTRAQIEAMFRAGLHVAPDPEHSTTAEQRFIAVGLTPEGRADVDAFCWQEDKILPISARYMHAREVARYAQPSPKTVPVLTTDKDAEDFLDQNPSTLDFTQFKPMRDKSLPKTAPPPKRP